MKRRNTKQRQIILDYVKSVHSHPSAEQIYNKIKSKLPNTTLATVYRNLNILVEENQISKIEVNNEQRFDGIVDDHQHCVCEKCSKVIDIDNKKIPEYAQSNFNQDFTLTKVSIVYHGLCKACSK